MINSIGTGIFSLVLNFSFMNSFTMIRRIIDIMPIIIVGKFESAMFRAISIEFYLENFIT